jgi:hypothetical protein
VNAALSSNLDDRATGAAALVWAPLVLVALTALASGCQRGAQPRQPSGDERSRSALAGASPESASYRIDGRVVALHDGKHAEPAAPGSAALDTTSVWGTPITADLDGDGDQDAVVIIATEPGGSGTFYYVAVAELDGGAYTGSAGVPLGDRIAPRRVTFADGIVTVDYAERRPGEPMSAQPTVTTSKRFVYRNGVLQPLEADKRF